MSRPQIGPDLQRPFFFLVATFSRLNQVATSDRCRDLKLSTPSRNMDFSCHDQGLLTPNLSQVATPKRMSRHKLFQSRLRRQNDVATSPCLAQVVRALLRSWVRTGASAAAHAAAPALRTCCLPVTRSTLGRDLVLEIGSSHSSFCLAQEFLFFFKTSSSFPATLRMQ